MNFDGWAQVPARKFIGYLLKKNIPFEHIGGLFLLIILIESALGQGPLV